MPKTNEFDLYQVINDVVGERYDLTKPSIMEYFTGVAEHALLGSPSAELHGSIVMVAVRNELDEMATANTHAERLVRALGAKTISNQI